MDESRFDTLAREWGRGTRRSVLQLVAGTGLGALFLERVGREDAEAACRAPGKQCKKKNGKKFTCCGGSRCQKGRCRCTNGGAGCGKACCQPGQICQDGAKDICVNGTLEPGDICDPQAPLGCQSGKCVCATFGENTACTCREEICFGFNNETCENTAQCCSGVCSEFLNPPKCVPA